MSVNRGKSFEGEVQKQLQLLPGISVDRVHDQTNGYKGSSNICDFIIYKYPYQYFIECKSVHGNLLSIHSNPKPDKNGVLHGFHGNITDKQWDGLLQKSLIPGCVAGVLCWWVDKDITTFLPINMLKDLYDIGDKSVSCYGDWQKYHNDWKWYHITGNKRRVFFDYDFMRFFENVEREYVNI
jgi:hypothetical protein